MHIVIHVIQKPPMTNIFKPTACYKYWYVLDKFDKVRCNCILYCKYPPPKELVPIKNNDKVVFKYTKGGLDKRKCSDDSGQSEK